MTIHHDKMVYGKLVKTSRELTDEEVLNMLAELDEIEEEETIPTINNPIKILRG